MGNKKKPNKNYGDCKYSSNFEDGWGGFCCDCIKKEKYVNVDMECQYCNDFEINDRTILED